MTWRLQGAWSENCNYSMICRCSPSDFTQPADFDRCNVVVALHLTSGQVEGVDVSNLNVVVLADTPPMMAEGRWRVGMFIDSAASREQAEKLEAILLGKLGGPWGKLAPLFGDFLGMRKASIVYSEEGSEHRLRVVDAVDIEIEEYVSSRNKNGEVTRLTGVGHTANSAITVAKPTNARAKASELEFSNNGKNGYIPPFSWSA